MGSLNVEKKVNMRRRGATKKLTKRERGCLEDLSVNDVTSGKCLECGVCKFGEGRDFNDLKRLRRGEDGSLLCPPCLQCPDGTYNDRGAAVCSRCVVQCATRHRNVARQCSRLGDAVCGSCMKGYYDFWKNSDMPCDKIKSKVSQTPTHAYHHSNVPSPVQAHRGKTRTEFEPPAGGSYQNLDKGIITAVSVLGSLVIIALVCYTAYRYIRKRKHSNRKRRTRIQRLNAGLIPRTPSGTDLGCDNDLEYDAAPLPPRDQKAMGQRLAHYERQHSMDGQLPYRVNPGIARPELPRFQSADSRGPMPELSLSCIPGPEAVQVHTPKTHITISPRPACSCHSYTCRLCSGVLDACSMEPILKGSKTLQEVAANICHNPVNLYQTLGIPEADIYQIDNDRDRYPERIPERENIMKLLNRWVELKARGATRHVLCKALCDSGFHRITEQIFLW